MKTNTCTDYITLILRLGGRWSKKRIKDTILSDYGLQFESDEIEQSLTFLMNRRKVLSAPVEKKGCVHFEYWWTGSTRSNKRHTLIQMTVAELMKRCLEAASTYPDDHRELKWIMTQYKRLENIKDKRNTYIKIY